MNKELFVKLSESKESNYVYIESNNILRNTEELKNKYQKHKDILKSISQRHNKKIDIPSFNSFKKQFTKINVSYDGRTNWISERQIMKALTKKGIIKLICKDSKHYIKA